LLAGIVHDKNNGLGLPVFEVRSVAVVVYAETTADAVKPGFERASVCDLTRNL
jgi:hypothetical protein